MATTVSMIYTNVSENEYFEYSPSGNYQLNSLVQSTAVGDHSIYRSLIDNNQGNPLTDVTKWLNTGKTNRWKLHDSTIQSKTSKTNLILNQYQISGFYNCVALLGVDGTNVRVRQFNQSENLVFEKTVTLKQGNNSADILNKVASDVVISNLTPMQNSYLEFQINAPNSIAEIGAMIVGEAKEIGKTRYGAKVGITSFDTKEQDQFGNYNVVPRAYRKIADLQLMVENSYIDQLQVLLAYYRSTPLLFVGSEQYTSTSIYGFIRDFDISITYPQHSLCSISVEGLT